MHTTFCSSSPGKCEGLGFFLARRGQKSANVLDFLFIELRKSANVCGLLLLTLPRRANVSQSERSRCEKPSGFPLRPPRIAIHSNVPFLAVRMYRSPCASEFKNRAFFVDRVAQSAHENTQKRLPPKVADFINKLLLKKATFWQLRGGTLRGAVSSAFSQEGPCLNTFSERGGGCRNQAYYYFERFPSYSELLGLRKTPCF